MILHYLAPSAADSRGPCPALNALANHSIIPHDGRNLTIQILVEAIQHVYNFTAPLAYSFAIAGIYLCGNGRTVDLEQLAKHNRIEHDASLSRQDFLHFPRSRPFNGYAPAIPDRCLVNQLLSQSDRTYLTLQDFASARVLRESTIVGRPLNSLHAELARGEVSMIIKVFGDIEEQVDKDVLCAWLVEGKLLSGWKRPTKVVSLLRCVLMSRRVASSMRGVRKARSIS